MSLVEENEKKFKDVVILGTKKKWDAFKTIIENEEEIIAVSEAFKGKEGIKNCIMVSTNKQLYIMYSELRKYKADIISNLDIVDVDMFFIGKTFSKNCYMDIKLRNGSGEIIKKTYELTSGRNSQNFVEKLKHMISEKPFKETESMNGLFNKKTSSSKADMLLELKNLLSNGILTIDEFNNEKEKILKM